jgi:hypothetical protein
VPVVAVLSAAALLYFSARWTGAMLWNGYRADMLVVIREATQRFLDGRSPYFTYRNTWDAPWDIVLPYGPVLWGPYVPAQLLRLDLRVVTIVGELVVPIWCAAAMTLEAARQRLLSAGAWGLLLATLLVSLDALDYTLMGHTAVYWPLLPLFAAVVTRRQWRLAAFALGVLIVARSTMVALIPVLLIGVWTDDRRRTLPAAAITGTTVLLLLLPFTVWDPHAIWDGMVTSYPRIVKQVVWTSSDGGATNTIGLTGWLLAHRLERFVEASELIAIAAVSGLAWRAISRGARPLPWMGLSLLAFSMTALWPVYYLYYDVLLLLSSAAISETLGGRLRLTSWLTALGAAVLVVAATMIVKTTPYPEIAAESEAGARAFRQGPTAIALPRRSASAANVVIDVESSGPAEEAQILTAILNGRALWTARVLAGPQEIRFIAPSAAWRIGHNRLELRPAGENPAPPAISVRRIAVTPR